LGDGYQSKSYIYVDDVIGAMRYISGEGWQGFDYFNVATEDYVTVREIADMVVQRLSLSNWPTVLAAVSVGGRAMCPLFDLIPRRYGRAAGGTTALQWRLCVIP
jgi:UDP-glucose 4-epimerase